MFVWIKLTLFAHCIQLRKYTKPSCMILCIIFQYNHKDKLINKAMFAGYYYQQLYIIIKLVSSHFLNYNKPMSTVIIHSYHPFLNWIVINENSYSQYSYRYPMSCSHIVQVPLQLDSTVMITTLSAQIILHNFRSCGISLHAIVKGQLAILFLKYDVTSVGS